MGNPVTGRMSTSILIEIACVKCFVKWFCVLPRAAAWAAVCGKQIVGIVLCSNVSYIVTGVC